MRSHPKGWRRSVDRGTCRLGIEPRKHDLAAQAAGPSGCRRSRNKRKATPGVPLWQGASGPRAVEDPKHAWNHFAREPGDPTSVGRRENCRPCREVEGRTPMTNGRGKSDRSKIRAKPPNNAEGTAAEAVEGRGLTKGKSPERNAFRTESPGDEHSTPEPVRQAPRRDRKQQF